MANLLENFDLGDLCNNSDLNFLNDDLFFNEAQIRNDDPLLTLSCKTNNVLDVIDLPQSPLSAEASPESRLVTSPWHESDSGVSENMSVSQSPEYIFDHQTQMQGADNPTRQRSTMNMVDLDEDIDRELAAYLNSSGDSDDGLASPSAHSTGDLEDFPFFNQSLLPQDSLVNVVSDDETQEHNGKSSKKSQGGSKAGSKQLVRSSGPSEVKILKVVRPSNTSEGVTSEDIAKAMEERSKKNAAQAKLNREKKKAYIQSLETEVEGLKSSNGTLKSENARMKQEISDKDEEIDYLKSVLANASALSNLLKNISDVKEVKLSAAIMTRKRAASDDHSYNLVENAPQKRARLIDQNLKKAGVCLHVKGETACLEFCAHCSKLAQKTYACS